MTLIHRDGDVDGSKKKRKARKETNYRKTRRRNEKDIDMLIKKGEGKYEGKVDR